MFGIDDERSESADTERLPSAWLKSNEEGDLRTVPSYVIAACVALAAFVVATVAGLASGNSAASILFHALLAMLACYPVGLLVGMACQRVIWEQLEVHRSANPRCRGSGNCATAAGILRAAGIVTNGY